MQFNLRLSQGVSKSKGLLPVVIMLLMFWSYDAGAQYHRDPWNHYGGGGGSGTVTYEGYAIVVSTDYDVPLGDLGTIYKGAPSFNLNVTNYWNDFTFNAGIGYHVYKPKADSLFYDDGAGGVGSVSYETFPVFSIYGGAAYNLQIEQGLRFYLGANLGAYYIRLGFQSNDQFGNSSSEINEQEVYIAPKFGFNIMFNNSVGVNLEGKYNFFSPSGNSQDNPRVGIVYKSYAVGLGLVIKL